MPGPLSRTSTKASPASEPTRVIEQVNERLPQNEAVAAHKDSVATRDAHVLILLLGQNFNHAGSFLCQVEQGELRILQLNASGVRSGHGEEAVDQPCEPVCLFQHASHNVPVVFGISSPLQGDLTNTSNGRKRRAEFV